MKFAACALFGGVLNHGVGGAGVTGADVVADGAFEQGHFLTDIGDLALLAGQADPADVLHVDQDAPPLRQPGARKNGAGDQRGLAAAAVAQIETALADDGVIIGPAVGADKFGLPAVSSG